MRIGVSGPLADQIVEALVVVRAQLRAQLGRHLAPDRLDLGALRVEIRRHTSSMVRIDATIASSGGCFTASRSLSAMARASRLAVGQQHRRRQVAAEQRVHLRAPVALARRPGVAPPQPREVVLELVAPEVADLQAREHGQQRRRRRDGARVAGHQPREHRHRPARPRGSARRAACRDPARRSAAAPAGRWRPRTAACPGRRSCRTGGSRGTASRPATRRRRRPRAPPTASPCACPTA